MSVDVVFSPHELAAGDVTDRTVLVIDALRATTTICAALHRGARAVVVAGDTEEATRLEQALGASDVLLAGERNSVRITGFRLGNSPLEMTADVVSGKTLIMTTTNGTAALLATAGAREVIVASAVNLGAAGAFARQAVDSGRNVLVLCAGCDHGFALDDAYIAGCVTVRAMGGLRRRKGLNDAALVAVDLVARYGDRAERVFTMSRAGRELAERGFRADVHAAAQFDAHPVLPIFHERRITLHAADTPG